MRAHDEADPPGHAIQCRPRRARGGPLRDRIGALELGVGPVRQNQNAARGGAQPPHPGRAPAKPSDPHERVRSKCSGSLLRWPRAPELRNITSPATRVPSAVLSRGGLIRHDFSDRATTNAGLPANRRAINGVALRRYPERAGTSADIASPRYKSSRSPAWTISSKLRVAFTEGQTRDHGVVCT